MASKRFIHSALAYVLLNARKHWRERHGEAPPVRIDAASSGRSFDGWKGPAPGAGAREPPEVASAHSWLLRVGWRRHGRIDPAEVPGAA